MNDKSGVPLFSNGSSLLSLIAVPTVFTVFCSNILTENSFFVLRCQWMCKHMMIFFRRSTCVQIYFIWSTTLSPVRSRSGYSLLTTGCLIQKISAVILLLKGLQKDKIETKESFDCSKALITFFLVR
jgi:hypothetical protein